jgi:glycerophosphoryl diester phosphodiesterase
MRRFIFAAILITACTPQERGGTLIIGHGGSGTEGSFPMNSRSSLLAGLRVADGIELDVQLTADGVLVAYHDDDLSASTRCAGKINAHAWEQLMECPLNAQDEEYPIIRLDSFLLEAAHDFPEADFTLDCKLFAQGEWWPYLELFANRIVALEGLPDLKGKLLVECQVLDFLQLVRERGPGIPVFLYATNAHAHVDSASSRGFTGITIDNDLITAEQLTQARSRGLLVTLFDVGAFGQRAALAKQPDRIQTDAPSSFLR